MRFILFGGEWPALATFLIVGFIIITLIILLINYVAHGGNLLELGKGQEMNGEYWRAHLNMIATIIQK